MTDHQPGNKRIDLSVTKVAAGSMAAVTSAVAASQLGTGGTLVGAGVGSVIATVGGAVYEHYIHRTRHQVRGVVLRRSAAQPLSVNVPMAADAAGAAKKEPSPSSLPLSMPAPTGQPGSARRGNGALRRSSRRLALGVTALAAFGIGLGVLTGFEAVTGKTVSGSVTGTEDRGTSIGHVFRGGSSARDTATESTPTPSPSATTGADQTPEPTSSPETATPTPTASTPTEAPVPAQQPTPEPTAPAPEPTVPAG